MERYRMVPPSNLKFPLPMIKCFSKGGKKYENTFKSATILLLFLGFSDKAVSEGSVRIPLPPPLLFTAPPPMVVIPNTYVYFSPNAEADVFFYHGHWYRPYEGRRYRSANDNGRWVYMRDVPPPLLRLPPDYRRVTMGHRRIPYDDLHRNWRSWERDRYWEKHNWNRGEERERHEFERVKRERGHHERD
jgi:hypothetical protein